MYLLYRLYLRLCSKVLNLVTGKLQVTQWMLALSVWMIEWVRRTQQQQKFRIITRIVAVKESKKTRDKLKVAVNSLTFLLLRIGSHSHFLSQNICPEGIQSPCKKCSYSVTALCEETMRIVCFKREARPEMCVIRTIVPTWLKWHKDPEWILHIRTQSTHRTMSDKNKLLF